MTTTLTCGLYLHNLANKGLRHFQIRKNSVRKEVHKNAILLKYIVGASNISDMFTKADKFLKHYLDIQDSCMISK